MELLLCVVDSCSDKQFMSDYCLGHKCAKFGCAMKRLGSIDTIDTWGKGCEWHQCEMLGCPNLKNIYYCKDHECSVDGCQHMCWDGAVICQQHKCSMDSCLNIRSSYYFCTNHIHPSDQPFVYNS